MFYWGKFGRETTTDGDESRNAALERKMFINGQIFWQRSLKTCSILYKTPLQIVSSIISSSERYSLNKRSQRYFISWCQCAVRARLGGDERQPLQGPSARWQRCKLPPNDIKHSITPQSAAEIPPNFTQQHKKGHKAAQNSLQEVQRHRRRRMQLLLHIFMSVMSTVFLTSSLNVARDSLSKQKPLRAELHSSVSTSHQYVEQNKQPSKENTISYSVLLCLYFMTTMFLTTGATVGCSDWPPAHVTVPVVRNSNVWMKTCKNRSKNQESPLRFCQQCWWTGETYSDPMMQRNGLAPEQALGSL